MHADVLDEARRVRRGGGRGAGGLPAARAARGALQQLPLRGLLQQLVRGIRAGAAARSVGAFSLVLAVLRLPGSVLRPVLRAAAGRAAARALLHAFARFRAQARGTGGGFTAVRT